MATDACELARMAPTAVWRFPCKETPQLFA